MEKKIFNKNLEFRVRTFGKKSYLFNFTKTYEINEVGRLIWSNIDGKKNIDELTRAVIGEHNIDENTALKDVTKFVTELQLIGAIL